jgi:lipid-binding SYLF domain-containing protein
MKNTILLMMLSFVAVKASYGYDSSEHSKRLRQAELVLHQAMAISPDQSIPQGLLDRAQCAVIVPGVKHGAFIFGARYGKGYISCRNKTGVGWTAPGTIRMEGGSFGFQVGGSETDIVMLVMNQRGVDRLLTSQFTLGGAAEVAAGPLGRSANAQMDALMTAQILSWSVSRGVFAGVSLQGATLRQDVSDNRELYGRTLENREIINQELPVPIAAKRLVAALNQYSSRK